MEQLTMQMLEQWNNLHCECWNNGTTYNTNVGTVEQLTIRMLEQRNNLHCECWNSGTTNNANVGQGEGRRGVSGKYGVGRENVAGRDLLDWCEENGLAYVNSYMRHERRGTWFNLRYGRWYELDGFNCEGE